MALALSVMYSKFCWDLQILCLFIPINILKSMNVTTNVKQMKR